jgi:hypothetical protein
VKFSAAVRADEKGAHWRLHSCLRLRTEKLAPETIPRHDAFSQTGLDPMKPNDVNLQPEASAPWHSNGEAVSLAGLFPDADYRFQMRFERGRVADFFRNGPAVKTLLAERRRWLEGAPDLYAGLLPEGTSLLEEYSELVRSPGIGVEAPPFNPNDPWRSCLELGCAAETDFLLLRPDEKGDIRLWCGCVCFPSSWSLAEKMGKPVDFIHSVVPGLNDQIGGPIAGFLRRVPPGISWLRANWGLSRTSELNLHPERKMPRLDSNVSLGEVWLRVEYQSLVALPRAGGVLFGIRLGVHPLADVKRDAAAAGGLRRALESMPEEMAVYKGIATARKRILRLLAD